MHPERYGRGKKGAAGPSWDNLFEQFVTLIEQNVKLLGISFGNPYLLQSFPGLKTYVVAYGDMPSLQQAVARALAGEIDINGKLPISLPGLYPRGTGIQVKATK